MYKFYKKINNKWKYCDTFNSTLASEYHAYINWCTANEVEWKLVRVSDNIIVHSSNNK